jgi:hypothetical protein
MALLVLSPVLTMMDALVNRSGMKVVVATKAALEVAMELMNRPS